jgi:hypothetical protein
MPFIISFPFASKRKFLLSKETFNNEGTDTVKGTLNYLI